MSNTFIQDVRTKANGHWEGILQRLGIPINRQESECPNCGGNTRYRFDDKEGRGTYFCSHCGAGTGLDLVMKVNKCDAWQAAEQVAEVLALPLPVITPASEKPNHRLITERVNSLVAKAVSGQSDYLLNKGLQRPSLLLDDGSLLLALQNMDGTTTGAQLIKPNGEKKLIAGSRKKGAFIPVSTLPEHTDTVIIAEGYATALTTSLLMQGVAISALDSGNLIHVARSCRTVWPDTKIILAADNDNKPDGSNTGKIAAEKAALAVNGWVTLPPTTEKADWNDYYQQHGAAVSISAFAASLYQPGKKQQPSSASPLKPYADIRHGGLYWVEPKTDHDSGDIIERESWLSDPITVAGIGSDESERYLVLSWTPSGESQSRTEAIPMRDIGEREGWARLRAGGLAVTAKGGLRAILADHLCRSHAGCRWAIASATGWQHGAYLMPDGSVIGSPSIPVLFNGKSGAAKGYATSGTAQSWSENVAALAQGNPSMMLGIACAFAAPLIGLVNADGFGVHLFGGSSAGKTTTGNIASSVYGDPNALKLTWYSTALGLVNEAAAHNDGFMPLDEIGQGSNRKAVADAAYALFNGVGKIQGAREGGNRELKRWRAMAFSTGEIDLESYIRADGGRVNAGQLVRLLNVPITKATVFHGYQDGKAHADAIRDASNSHYGAVGRAWITHLASQKENSLTTYRKTERRWLSLLPNDASEQVRRVASRFAVLEAALLLSASFTGWTAQECHDALQHSFYAWVNEFGMGNREAKAWVEQADAFLHQFGYSRYLPHPNPDPRDLPIKDLAGYRVKKPGADTLVFHTFPAVFNNEIAVGANAAAFAQVLVDAGMLDKPAKGITRKSLRIDGKQPRFVVLMTLDDEEE
ncbi:TOPRIM and DUF927 domain-containing protein [Pectobacterium sp. IFB5596]|uniref:TOPRIM and DUF927 domain-containing protein n=1 Tax=Pectobacterium sp. IFB5596 TaxID=1839803 RepID=UPI001F161ADD|nr:TOPRIM and DUF927 domain-containing protein [Pectobacterium sp. IFB5596]MCE9732944.1 DNA primase [Pectobacterium sp. IFB5596]GKW09902.1 hypothetical protein PEC301899_01840 [Pectobacterium carotovorum subsp. carotovorum]